MEVVDLTKHSLYPQKNQINKRKQTKQLELLVIVLTNDKQQQYNNGAIKRQKDRA